MAPPRKYPQELRDRAVRLVKESDRPIAQIAADLGIHRKTWRTRDQVEYAIVEWIGWYNNRRLHSAIGNVPPAEYEATYYRLITTPAPTGAR